MNISFINNNASVENYRKNNANKSLSEINNKGKLENRLNRMEENVNNNGLRCSKDLLAKYSSSDGKVISKVMAADPYENHHYQQKLSVLGFYSGPIDGNISSSVFKNAVSLFQKVYGITGESGFSNNTKNKLENAYNAYNNVYSSQGLKDIVSTYKLDSDEKNNIAKTWAFLRTGMGLTAAQSAGVMGNMLLESNFAADNAQNSSYPKDHNSNYSYKTDDGIAYGLIQWKASNRKTGLLTKANELGLSTSNLNAQLAFFRQEMTSSVNNNSYYKGLWEKYVITKTSTADVCKAFQTYIEGCSTGTEERKERAQAIYDAFAGY